MGGREINNIHIKFKPVANIRILGFGLVLTLFGLAACAGSINDGAVHSNIGDGSKATVSDSPMNTPSRKIVDSALERNRRLWESKQIADYDYVVEKRGMMNSWIPFSIRVRDARAVAMEPVREAMVLEHADGYEEYDTFEKIFDLLQQAYERKYPVRVKYNKEYGYPENMTIQPMEATDLTYWLEITRFEKAGSE